VQSEDGRDKVAAIALHESPGFSICIGVSTFQCWAVINAADEFSFDAASTRARAGLAALPRTVAVFKLLTCGAQSTPSEREVIVVRVDTDACHRSK